MDVGIRELKKHLSQYLDRVAQGEIVRVTDRGSPKAVLMPLPGAERNRGVEEGWIRPGRRDPVRPVPRFSSDQRVLDVLAEDRGE